MTEAIEMEEEVEDDDIDKALEQFEKNLKQQKLEAAQQKEERKQKSLRRPSLAKYSQPVVRVKELATILEQLVDPQIQCPLLPRTIFAQASYPRLTDLAGVMSNSSLPNDVCVITPETSRILQGKLDRIRRSRCFPKTPTRRKIQVPDDADDNMTLEDWAAWPHSFKQVSVDDEAPFETVQTVSTQENLNYMKVHKLAALNENGPKTLCEAYQELQPARPRSREMPVKENSEVADAVKQAEMSCLRENYVKNLEKRASKAVDDCLQKPGFQAPCDVIRKQIRSLTHLVTPQAPQLPERRRRPVTAGVYSRSVRAREQLQAKPEKKARPSSCHPRASTPSVSSRDTITPQHRRSVLTPATIELVFKAR